MIPNKNRHPDREDGLFTMDKTHPSGLAASRGTVLTVSFIYSPRLLTMEINVHCYDYLQSGCPQARTVCSILLESNKFPEG